jgi:5-oxoprolinase (ATP-hydrolysing) subunit A
VRADSICIHSDTPNAVAVAMAVAVAVAPFVDAA